MNQLKNSFKDLSFEEGILLFTAFVFAVFLRFYDLGAQQPWTDELASWFFLRNLDHVYLYESHTPLYYFLLRIFLGSEASIAAIRGFSAATSTICLILTYFLGTKVLGRKKAILLFILLAFCPADLVYSRLARHYSLLLHGSLLFYLLVKANAKTWILWTVSLFFGFLHIFFYIPFTVILIFDYFEKRDLKKCLIVFSSTIGIVLYYIARIIFIGKQKVADNVQWNTHSFETFWASVVVQFLGDAYPRDNFFPVNMYLALGYIGILLGYALFRKKRSVWLLVGIILGSLFFIEGIAFWINLRKNRYVIYLSAFLILAFVDAFPEIKKRHLFFGYALGILFLIPLNLLTTYSWNGDIVKEWHRLIEQNPGVTTFVCANQFQAEYYHLSVEGPCIYRVDSIDLKKPLLFLDLNNNDKLAASHILNRMKPVSSNSFDYSTIIKFEPR